jgi:hypothetical protein
MRSRCRMGEKKSTGSSAMIGATITYTGKKVMVVEAATGFVKDPDSMYWVRALEPVAGYKEGEEFTVSVEHVEKQLRR